MKHERKVVSTGTISIFLILVVLLFVTFSLLSFTLSTSDLRLSKRAAETVSEYYEADDSATKRLYAYITAAEAEGTDSVKDKVEKDGGTLEVVEDGYIVCFCEPVNDSLSLFAEARVTEDSDGASSLNIIRWQCAGNEN